MKTLYLLRHAEAEDNINDLKRILTTRGHRQALSMGRWMLKNGIIPESVFSSPAERTKLTAKICLKQIVFKGKFYVEDALYDTHADTYADVLAGINNAENSIMVVGHNPEISDTVTMLTGENIFMTPCSMACIEFSTVDWISVFSEKGILKWVETPR